MCHCLAGFIHIFSTHWLVGAHLGYEIVMTKTSFFFICRCLVGCSHVNSWLENINVFINGISCISKEELKLMRRIGPRNLLVNFITLLQHQSFEVPNCPPSEMHYSCVLSCSKILKPVYTPFRSCTSELVHRWRNSQTAQIIRKPLSTWNWNL